MFYRKGNQLVMAMSAYDQTMFDFEKDLVTKYLNENDWNITNTAIKIGVSRQVLYFKIRKFEITRCKVCDNTGYIYSHNQPIRCSCNPTPKKEYDGKSVPSLPTSQTT